MASSQAKGLGSSVIESLAKHTLGFLRKDGIQPCSVLVRSKISVAGLSVSQCRTTDGSCPKRGLQSLKLLLSALCRSDRLEVLRDRIPSNQTCKFLQDQAKRRSNRSCTSQTAYSRQQTAASLKPTL